MVAVLVIHADDTELRDGVNTARDFASRAHPDVNAAEWRMRPAVLQSIVMADDVHQSLSFSVFEWGEE